MKKEKNQINGWLIVNKPADIGSTNVVSKTRYIYNAKKNGHTGTLDPFATGVLPIAFGEATKLVEYVMDGDKEYEFLLQFGSKTNTDDYTGEVIETCKNIPSENDVLSIIDCFIGKIKQTPSKFSAIKIDGKRAYDLAREGKEFDIKQREVEVYDLKLLSCPTPTSVYMKVSCSKGTYVRTLAKDMAEKLGSLGHLTMLKRTKNAIFDINDCVELDDVSDKTPLIDIKAPLLNMIEVKVLREDAIKLKHGMGLSPKVYELEDIGYATYNNELIAIIKNDGRKIAPIKVFNLW